MRLLRLLLSFIFFLGLAVSVAAQPRPIEVKVVVVAMFEMGKVHSDSARRDTDREALGGCGFEGGGGRRSFQRDKALRLATGTIEPGQVGSHLGVIFERQQCGGENRRRARIGGQLKAVMHPCSIAARADDAGPAQIGQVPGDLGLALPENPDKITDAYLAVVHEIDQAEASTVGQGGKESRQIEGGSGAAHVS